jgi:predicted small metal-binding protein
MGKSLKCKDIGLTDCTWEATADTEEELIELAKEHAPVHDIKEITPELLGQLKAAMTDV